MNWFKRHLNWTVVLGCAATFPVGFMLGFVPAAALQSEVFFITHTTACLMPLIICGWVLKEKSRSPWWLLMAWIPFLGWTLPVALENQSERPSPITHGPHAALRTPRRDRALALVIVMVVALMTAKACGHLQTSFRQYEVLSEQHSTVSGPVEEAWVVFYGGAGKKSDSLADIAVDASGNVYVTGSVTTRSRSLFWPIINNDVDYATIKYDRDGNRLWAAHYDGEGLIDLPSAIAGSTKEASAVAVDNERNVYVTGTAGTVKYDPDGRLLWADGREKACGTDITADDSGCVYVMGDAGTVKYDSAGNELCHEEDGIGIGDLDDDGNVWVVRNGVLKQYDSDGQLVTSLPFEGTVAAVAADTSGNVYVTGTIYGSFGADFGTVKYDAQANQVWAARHDGRNGGRLRSIAVVDGTGDVYVAGIVTVGIYNASAIDWYFADQSGAVSWNHDFIVMKYSQ